MKISVVIPALNEEKYLGKTLESIKNLEKDHWDLEVLVVDGGSQDKTPQIAKKFGARVVIVPHRGIGFARQTGLEEAKGEIVVFTDADTLVPKDWLKRHLSLLQKENVAGSFGFFRLLDGSFPYYHFTNFLQPIFVSLLSFFGLPFPPGQNLACWRKKALAVGGFDESLPLMEDIDFAIRLKKAGRVVFQPDLLVFSSGRRAQEGWRFFFRVGKALILYFLFGQKKLGGFPHFR